MNQRNDADRPQFHFTSKGWINDPHGITVVDGAYHLFFQHVPGNTAWGLGCSWGHATGPDLFSLRELPGALEPGDGDDGVWSGSLAVDAAGMPRIFYTSVSEDHPAVGHVRSAVPSDDRWLTWEKGPVVARPPVGAGVTVYRDPTIVRSDGKWRMLVGAGFADGSAGVLGYVSDDGEQWAEDGTVVRRSGADRDPLWTGSMWECPQIIEVDGRWALIVSVWDEDVLHDVVYALGEYVAGVFTPETWGRLSHGPSPYAATTFLDADGSPCLMFWLRDVAGAGWAGAHSIPYRIDLRGGALVLSPHPDLARHHAPQAGSRAIDITWPAAAGDSLELHHDHGTALRMERTEGVLSVGLGARDFDVPWADDLRIIVDGPVVEISSSAGVFAAPLENALLGPADGAGSWTTSGADVTVHGLRRGSGTEHAGG